MLLSFFKAKEIGKMPISKDNIFEFYQKDIDVKDFYKINKDFWILNGNFKFPSNPFKSKRTKLQLEKYISQEFNFIIIDLDDVSNEKAIIDILKHNDFHFSLWQSSSYNGINNFNMKGVIEFVGINNDISRKKAIQYIDSLLKDYCKVDYSSIRPSAIQKPTHKDFICYHNGKNILEFYFNEEEHNYVFDDELLNLCLRVYESLGYYICNEKDNLISLGHPKEKTKCGYFIFKDNPQICHHFNKSKTFSIYDYIKNEPIFKKYNQKKLILEFEEKLFKPVDKITFNQRYINIDVSMDKDEAIIVKSPMGTGKTNIIKQLEKNKRVLLITNRITLAEEYKQKFPHFKLYNKDIYFKGDSVITQYDSLHKYDLKEFDLFIIDEFMSLIEHSLSGLSQYDNINNLKLFYILNKLKEPLLVMDAFLTGYELELIKRKKIRYYENLYRDNNNLFLYENINCFIETLEDKLSKKEGKITLSTTNKSFAKVIYEIFKNKYKIAIITSETIDKSKYTQHFNKEFHNEWDLLIYTPTITTGINILNESNHHFHYSDGTGSVINSLQQIKRNRLAKNIHFFLKGRKYNKIINFNELKTYIENKLKEYANKNSLLIEFDEYANPKLNNMGIFQLKKIHLNNLLNVNSLFTFKILLKEQFKNDLIEVKGNCKNYDIKNKLKELKEKEKLELQNKIDELLNLEGLEFIFKFEYNFKELKSIFDKYFVYLTENDIKELLEIIKNDKNFLSNINYLRLFLMDIEFLKEIINSNLVSTLNKAKIRNLELIYKYKKKIILKEYYTLKDTKNKEFKKFIKLLGYKRKNNVYTLKDSIKKFLNKIKKE